MSALWITVSIIFAVVWSWCIWEACNTPITPNDYNNDQYNGKTRTGGLMNDRIYEKQRTINKTNKTTKK